MKHCNCTKLLKTVLTDLCNGTVVNQLRQSCAQLVGTAQWSLDDNSMTEQGHNRSLYLHMVHICMFYGYHVEML